jgi:TP901 family phage tail tape measure protein
MAAPININANLNLNPASINASAKQVQQALGRITGQASEFQKSLDASTARVFAFGATTSIINGITQSFKALVSTTVNVQAKLTEINSILGAGATEFNKYRNSIFQVAKETGQSFNTVASGAAELARQGLGATESAKRLQAALILTRISGLGAEQSVKALTAAMNGFTSAGLTANQVVNKIVAVDTAFAVSAQDLADGFSRAGSTAEDAGVSFDELLGLITAVEQRTARGGAVIGNAFKSIFTRISRGSTIEKLKELGVEIDANQTGVQKLQALSKALEGVADPTIASQIKELAGGVFQINVVSAALKDIGSQTSVFAEATKVGMAAANEATEKNAKLNETLLAQLNKLTVAVTSFAEKLGDLTLGPLLKNVVGLATTLSEGLDRALDPERGNAFVQGLFKIIGGFLSGPGLAIFTVAFAKIFKTVIRFAREGFSTIMKMGTAAEKISQIETGLIGLLQKDAALRKTLESTTASQATKEKAVIDAIKRENALLSAQQQIVTNISNIARQGGVTGYSASSGSFKGKGGKRYASGGNGVMEPDLMTAMVNEARDSPAGASPYVTNFRGSPAVMNTSEMQVNIGGREEILTAGQIPRFAKTSLSKQQVAANKKRQKALNRDGEFIMLHGEKSGYKLNKFYVGPDAKDPSKASSATKSNTDGTKSLINVPTYGVPKNKKGIGDIKEFVQKLRTYSTDIAMMKAQQLSNGAMPSGRKQAAIKKKISSQVNEGSVKGFAGTVQEMALGSLLSDGRFEDYINQSSTSNFDLNLAGQNGLKNLYNVRKHRADTGEVKGSGNNALAADTARKIYRVKSMGQATQSFRKDHGESLGKKAFTNRFPAGYGPSKMGFLATQRSLGIKSGKIPTSRLSSGTISNSRLASRTGIRRFNSGSMDRNKVFNFGRTNQSGPSLQGISNNTASQISQAKNSSELTQAYREQRKEVTKLAKAQGLTKEATKDLIKSERQNATQKGKIISGNVKGAPPSHKSFRMTGGGGRMGASIKSAMGNQFGAGMGLSMAGSGLTIAAEKLNEAGQETAAQYTKAAGTVMQFAATGAMIGGPWGAAIGGIAGMGYAVYDHFDAEEKKLQAIEDSRISQSRAEAGGRYVKGTAEHYGFNSAEGMSTNLSNLSGRSKMTGGVAGPIIDSIQKRFVETANKLSSISEDEKGYFEMREKFNAAAKRAAQVMLKRDAILEIDDAISEKIKQIESLVNEGVGATLGKQMQSAAKTSTRRSSLLGEVGGNLSGILQADNAASQSIVATGNARATYLQSQETFRGTTEGTEARAEARKSMKDAEAKYGASREQTAIALTKRRMEIEKQIAEVAKERASLETKVTSDRISSISKSVKQGPIDLSIIKDFRSQFAKAGSDQDKASLITELKGTLLDKGANGKMVAVLTKMAGIGVSKQQGGLIGSTELQSLDRNTSVIGKEGFGEKQLEEFYATTNAGQTKKGIANLDTKGEALNISLANAQESIDTFAGAFSAEIVMMNLDAMAVSLKNAGTNIDAFKTASDGIAALVTKTNELSAAAGKKIDENLKTITGLKADVLDMSGQIQELTSR